MIKERGILSKFKPMPVDPSRVEMGIALEDHEEESTLLRRIDREVDSEDELVSPRGDLARLLRLKADAEWNASRRSVLAPVEPVAEAGPSSEPSPPDGVCARDFLSFSHNSIMATLLQIDMNQYVATKRDSFWEFGWSPGRKAVGRPFPRVPRKVKNGRGRRGGEHESAAPAGQRCGAGLGAGCSDLGS